MNGKKVFVGQFVPKKERQTSNEKVFTNIYIKDLDEKVDEERLKQLFIPFGQITNTIIMRDEAGNSKGFGFINFSRPEEAHLAVNEMSNKRY